MTACAQQQVQAHYLGRVRCHDEGCAICFATRCAALDITLLQSLHTMRISLVGIAVCSLTYMDAPDRDTGGHS